MRYVVVGLGAIGGTLAAQLHQAGNQVLGVARGAHLVAIRDRGLLLRTPEGEDRITLDVAASLGEAGVGADDVVVLAVKSQDTVPLLAQLATIAAPTTPVACAQNGVRNEPEALRWFERVYGIVVMCPTVHLQPGVVAAYSTPTVGILDVGRFPAGQDQLSRQLATELRGAGYSSKSVSDVARWKYAKLVTNLGNAVEAVCGPDARGGQLTGRLQAEARRVLDRHGIAYATTTEDQERRGSLLTRGSIDGPRPGGSVWQSVMRHQPDTEVDYLCGEVVRLARLAGLTAPTNMLLQRLTHAVCARHQPIGGLTEEQVLSQLDRS